MKSKVWVIAFTFIAALAISLSGQAFAQASQGSMDSEIESLRRQVVRLKEEISAAQKVAAYYQPQSQSHGFVWLFQRRPSAK